MSITCTSIPSTNTNTNILHHLLLLFTFTTLILLTCIPTVSSRHLQILNSPADEVTNDDAGNIQLKPIRLALYTTPTLSNETVDQVGEIIGTIMTNPMEELYEDTIFDLDELDLVVLEFVSIYKVVYGSDSDSNSKNAAAISSRTVPVPVPVSPDKETEEEEDEGFGTRMRIPKANHDESLRSLQQRVTEQSSQSSQSSPKVHSVQSNNENPTSKRNRNLAETIYGTEIILGGNITFNGNTVPSKNRAFKETIQTMKSLTDQIQSAIQNSDNKDLQTVNFLKVARYKNLGPTARPSLKPSLTPSALPNVVPSSQPTIIPSIVRSSVPTITASDQPSLLPSITPTSQPSTQPSTSKPTSTPSLTPSSPTMSPIPTLVPSISLNPSSKPSKTPTLPTNIIAADDVDGSIENKGLDTGGSGMESWMLVTACAAAGLLVVGSGYYIRKRRNSDLNLGPHGNGIDVNDGGNEGNGNGTTTTKTRGGFGFGIKKHKKNGSLTQVELKQLNEEERKKFHLQDVSDDDDDDLVEIDLEGGKRYTGTPLPRCGPFFSSASPSKGSARSSSVGEDSPSSTAGTIMGFLGSSFTRVPSTDPSISSGTPLSRPRGLPRSVTPQRNRSSGTGTGTGSETETSKEGISSSSSSPSPSPPGATSNANTYGMVHSPSNPWSASAAASNDRSKTPGTTTSTTTTTKNNNNILSTPDFPNTISLGGHHSSSTTKMGNKSIKIKTLKNNHNQNMTPSSSARPISPSSLSPRSQKSHKSSGSTKSAASLEMAHSPHSSPSNKSGGRSKKVMTPPSTKRSMTLDLFGNEIPPPSTRTTTTTNNETTHETNAVDLETMHNIMMGNARSPPAGGTSTGGSNKKIRSPPPSSSSKKNSKSTNGGGTIPPPPSSSSMILGIERVITTPPKTKKMVLNSSNTSSPMTSVKASKVSKEEFERADWDDEIPFHWDPTMEKELVGVVAAAGGRSSSKKKKSSLKPPTSPTKSTPKRNKVKDHYHSSENEDSSDGAFPRFQMSERDTTITASTHRRRKSKGSTTSSISGQSNTSVDASSSKSNSLQNSPHTNGESTAYHTVNQSYGSSNPDDVDVGGSSLNSSRSSSLHPLDWSNKGSMDTDQEVGRRMKGKRGGGGNDGTSTLEDSSLSDNAVSPSARRRRQRHRRRLKVDLPSDSEDGDFLTPRSQFTMGTSGTRGDIGGGGGGSHHLPTTPMTNASSVRSTYTNSTLGDASGASSKQLIKDLVWLEKKIADVKARVDRLDPEEEDFHANTTSNNSSPDTQGATTANNNNNNNNRSNNNDSQESMPSSSAPSTPSTPMSRDSTSTDGEGMIGSPISHNIVCRDCYAPPGKLHIVILSTKDGPEIKTVKPGSALEGKLFAGDLLVAVDDIDTRMMTSEAVMELMTARNTEERKLTVLHYDSK